MQAAVIRKTEGVDVLEYVQDFPKPERQAAQVRFPPSSAAAEHSCSLHFHAADPIRQFLQQPCWTCILLTMHPVLTPTCFTSLLAKSTYSRIVSGFCLRCRFLSSCTAPV
jgi:hypothetical protein